MKFQNSETNKLRERNALIYNHVSGIAGDKGERKKYDFSSVNYLCN